jgi:hypothetical protein
MTIPILDALGFVQKLKGKTLSLEYKLEKMQLLCHPLCLDCFMKIILSIVLAFILALLAAFAKGEWYIQT